MVSGAQIATGREMSDQHSCTRMSRSTATPRIMKAPRKPKLIFICCTAIPLLLLLQVHSASAFAGSAEQTRGGGGLAGEVKTFQQLRSRGQSSEQYRSKVVAENLVMMTKTSPLAPDSVPVAVTETYGRERLQVVAPTNATIAESPAVEAPMKRSEMSTGTLWAMRLKAIVQSQGFQKMVMGNFINQTTKKWRPTGNDLWDGIITDCVQNPTFSCMQKNMYSYLDRTLLTNDLNVTDNFLFLKNQVNYTDELIRSNEIDGNEDFAPMDIDPESRRRSLDEDDTTEAESPLEEVTNAMYDKTRRFAMTHDIQLKLPKTMFDGAILRISPRSFEGNGALVKIELEPDTRSLQESHGSPRFILKKIKKMFKSKLLLGFLAVVVVVKLIKIKLLWFLPFLIGYGAAKKLVLKVLLFFFPALAHIFKLCSWYHHNYHHGATKLHQHNHHIAHTHTVVPPWFDHPHGPPHGHSSHEGPTLIYTKPPTGHPSEYLHGNGPSFEHYPQDWELSGPGLGAEYISNRKSHEEPKDTPKFGHPQTVPPSPSSHSLHLNPFTQSPQPDSKYVPSGPAFKNPTASRIAAQYQAMPDPRQNGPNHNNLASIDPFYGPILTKIDTIFAQLGVNDEPCKERLLCSMYKNPTQYSPHSNFISAELSRDATELKRAPTPNAAVTRFYRYIQAARDGQEHRDCLNLYNLCTINTEQRRRK